MNKAEYPGKLSFAPLMEKYFLSFMITQRKSSPRTIITYRDSIRLYLGYLDSVHQVKPDKVEMEHFSLDYLSAFAEYLEQQRKCSASTINLRIAAIKSFLKYSVVEAPEYSGIIRKSLTLPAQKSEKPVMTFITKNEYETMLEVSNDSDILSLRDKMMLMILYNTGCRVSELINVHTHDVVIAYDGTSSIRFIGKGRKERVTPIWKTTATFIGAI